VKSKSGKETTVYYYHAYDENGVRRSYSTGKKTKTEAALYIRELDKAGKLIPEVTRKVPTIREYSKDYWIFEGDRVQSALLRKRLTPAYCNANHRSIELHWWPLHGDTPMDKLTVRDIEALITLKSKGDPTTGAKPLSSKMVTQIVNAMKAVFTEAVRLGDLESSPFDRVQPVQIRKVARNILTPQEAAALLSQPENFENRLLWALNLTAATSGARAGELLGLQVKAVFKDRIEIRAVKRAKVGLVEDTKTGEKGFRFIPIPPQTAEILAVLCQGHKPDDLVFGDLEFYETAQSLARALEKAGIMTNEERIARRVDFHSWRHYFNSVMRGKVSDAALRSATGHLTSAMTGNYSHQLDEHLVEVGKAQAQVFSKLKPVNKRLSDG